MWRYLLRALVITVLGLTAVSPPDVSASTCPNEALRSELRSGQLPDCRAYELVSPAYKEGSIIISAFADSPDGSRLIGSSFGTFAGAEQLPLSLTSSAPGAVYRFSRAPTGWTAAALGPPASSYGNNGILDASGNLDATLWALEPQPPTEVSDIYLEPSRGTFLKVGSPTPAASGHNASRYAYRGASGDLSRVLFSAAPGSRWPYDGTVAEGGTLYEYTGVEQAGETREPALVGVEGGRGSKTLVSECGTRLGSSSPEERAREIDGLPVRGSMYNAISASGNRIYFTAVGKDEAPGCEREAPPASELFAREELPLTAGELPVAGMRTVAISEPSSEECGECLTKAGLRDAVFQGASQDGLKAFFTTEQELLPDAKGNNLYEYDFDAPAGERVTLLSGGTALPEVQGVARISEDGSHIYFVADGVLTEAPNGTGNEAVAGARNLYVYAEGRISFVATLAPGDSSDWARSDARSVMASGDGRFLVFASVADLTAEGLQGSKTQVFQYDAATGVLVRASIGQDGYNDNGRGPVDGSALLSGFGTSYRYSESDSPVSANGVQAPANGAVFFESPDALTPQALSDRHDALGDIVANVYEYQAGHVYLLSDGRDTSTVNHTAGSYLVGWDPSGANVFFLTSDSLIPGDANTQQDLYDARATGGFPFSAQSGGCIGEACQGALAAPPALAPLAGSATQTGEEDARAASPPPPKAKPKAAKTKRKAKARRQRRAGGRRAGRAALHGRTLGSRAR